MQYFASNDTKFCAIPFSSVYTNYHKRMRFNAASCSSHAPGSVEDAFGRLTFALLGKDRHCSSFPDSLHSNAPGATYHVLRDGNDVLHVRKDTCHRSPVPSLLVSSERKFTALTMATTSLVSETSKVLSLFRVPLDIFGINAPLFTSAAHAALTMANSAPRETSSHDTPTPQATTNTPPEPPLPQSRPRTQ